MWYFVPLCSDAVGWAVDRNGIQPIRSCVLVCWWWPFDWSFALHVIAPAITTTSIILSSSKIQNGRHSGTGIPWLTRKMVVKRVSLLCLVQSYDNYCNLPKKSTTKYQLYFATMLTRLSRNNCTNTYNLLTAVTSLCTKLQNNSILINYYSKFCKRVFFTKFLSDTTNRAQIVQHSALPQTLESLFQCF